MSKLNFIANIKQFRSDLGKMTRIGQLIDYIPYSSAEKVAVWMLTAVVISPLYILIRSIFLKYHEKFYFLDNQFTLGSYWVSLLQEIGYLGLLLLLFVFMKSIRKCRNDGIGFKQYLLGHLFQVFLLLMLLWSALSSIFSSNVILALNGTMYRREGLYTYLAYAGIFTWGSVIHEEKKRRFIMKLLVITATILSLFTLLNNEFLNQLLTLRENAALFYNINHFAYYLCLSSMASAFLALSEKKFNWKMLLWVITFALLIVTLIKNSSFGPYLAVACGMIFVLTFIILYARKSTVTAIVVFVVFVVLSITMNMKSNFLVKEATRLSDGINNIVENNDKAEQAGSNRWGLWVKGMEYALEKPIFGYGPENLADRYHQDGLQHDRPHNELIQFAASLGIPAALFYTAAMIIYFLPLLIYRKMLSHIIIGWYGISFTYFLSSMFGNSMFYTTPFYFMVLGLSCNLFRRSQKCPGGNTPD